MEYAIWSKYEDILDLISDLGDTKTTLPYREIYIYI